jgi:hypothetical protein
VLGAELKPKQPVAVALPPQSHEEAGSHRALRVSADKELRNVRRRVSHREWVLLLGVLLVAFGLRVVQLTDVPPGLHNDEVVDIKITESVAQGRLALFFPEDTGAEPLYYYLAAPFLRVFGANSFGMRLPAVFLGTVASCAIWAFSRRLFGPCVALVAICGYAVVFWTVAFGRIALHVVMEVPLAAMSAYFLWRTAAGKGWRAFASQSLAGCFLGLSIQTYTAARVLPLVFMAFGVYVLLVEPAQWRRWWGKIGLALIAAGVVVSPLALYLLRNPAADQLSFYDIDRPLTELRQGNLAPVIETSLRTLGMFAFLGDPLPYYDVPGRPVFGPFGALLLVVGLSVAVGRWREPRYGFVLLWFTISLTPGMLSQPAPNYTRTLGVQVVLFTLLGVGADWLLGRGRHLAVSWALVLLLSGNLGWTIRDYFVVWPSLESVRFWHQSGLKAVADWLQNSESSAPAAICVPDHLVDEREPWWKAAWEHMGYLVQREDLELRFYNCADATVLVDGAARYAFLDIADQGGLDEFPAFRGFLASVEADPIVLEDGLAVIVDVATSNATSRLRSAVDHRIRSAAVGSEVSWPEGSVTSDLPSAVPVNFEGRVELLAYELSESVASPGESVELTTYWRVLGPLPPQLTQFTHVLDASGTIVAQEDRLAITSASLRKGDVFSQAHNVVLPADLSPGDHSLSVGLYLQTTGERLRIGVAGGTGIDRLMLRPIPVVG